MNICKIPPKSKLLFGHGGSRTIIVITKNNEVYKYFPLISYVDQSDKSIERYQNEFKKEILILQLLTKHFIKNNKTPHLVEIYKTYFCDEVPKSFFKNCLKYSEYLISKGETDKVCNYLYRNYPTVLNKGMHIANIEFCDSKLEDQINNISKKSIDEIKSFLDRLFFQVIFTLEIIRDKYPLFIHGDLFIRNILTIKNDSHKDGEYIKYILHNKEFYLPANGLFIKMNDFGLTQITEEIEKKYTPDNKIIEKDDGMYRDWFNIIYDVYDGGNLGSNSLMNLLYDKKNKNKDKIKFIKKYFNRFMDIKVIDKIIKNKKKENLNWDWRNTYDKSVVNLLKIQKPDKILKYFESVYKDNNIDEDQVVKIYGH
jgi:hypothetical protein